MKVAVINFSGNVGKTTIARHLLLPRMPGAELVSIESANSGSEQGPALRGRQFAELQEYLQTVSSAVVDIGASNIEDMLDLMQQYSGSHKDFDCFIVPTVPAVKQQQDTIATLVDLAQLGVKPERLKVLFNMVHRGTTVDQVFYLLQAFLADHPIATADTACRLRENEIYARLRRTKLSLSELASDMTDYKALIAKAPDTPTKIDLAQQLATQRLACGVLPELDSCFAALHLAAEPSVPSRAAKKA